MDCALGNTSRPPSLCKGDKELRSTDNGDVARLSRFTANFAPLGDPFALPRIGVTSTLASSAVDFQCGTRNDWPSLSGSWSIALGGGIMLARSFVVGANWRAHPRWRNR